MSINVDRKTIKKKGSDSIMQSLNFTLYFIHVCIVRTVLHFASIMFINNKNNTNEN